MFDQLKQMKDLAGMLGNLGDIKEKAEQLKAELEQKSVEGNAGAGAVVVIMNGKFEVQSVKLDPAMIQVLAGDGTDTDQAMVQDLIAAAVNDAVQKVQALMQEHMGDLMGGMDLPFNLPGM